MNLVNPIAITITAFIGVFFQAYFDGFRNLLGAQISVLPPLMVYASLTAGVPTITILAVLGGLCFDSLSANPLGVSMLPLFVIGFLINRLQGLILRNQTFAQFMLGLGASAVIPLFTVLLILSGGGTPLLGWGSLWQWIVMSLGGALLTPLMFQFFGIINGSLSYRPLVESSFRPDREIRRGR